MKVSPSSMEKLNAKIAKLSPEKQALFAQKIKQLQSNRSEAELSFSKNKNCTLPVFFAQQRIWSIQQQQARSPVFNVYRTWRIKGALKIDALQQGLNTIVSRHEMLRTGFSKKEGKLTGTLCHDANIHLSDITLNKVYYSNTRRVSNRPC